MAEPTLGDFVGANYPARKTKVLLNGLKSLKAIHANRAWEDWRCVLQAFTLISEEVVADLKKQDVIPQDADVTTVATAKGTPFQKAFLPRWERYEALLGGNHEPLTKSERANLRELVKLPAILQWHEGLADHNQRQLNHPNRIVMAWKRVNRRPGEPAPTATALAMAQRVIHVQDGTLVESRKRIATLKAELEEHEWNAAQEIDALRGTMIAKAKSLSARDQADLLRAMADELGFGQNLVAILAKR